MGLAFRPGTFSTGALPDGSTSPPEIAFLRTYGVSTAVLDAACVEARRVGVEPLEALLAGGAVTDTLVYKSLARRIGVTFRNDWAPLDRHTNPLRGLRDGRVLLADGIALLAPRGPAMRLLLRAADEGHAMRDLIAIATPAHCEALVLRRSGASLARRASLALPTLEPTLSARGAVDLRAALVAAAILSIAILSLVSWPAALAAPASLMFLAAITFRTFVCAEGARVESEPPPRRSPDAELPRYSVLVPLYREAGMVADVVRNLSDLDYPAAKLEILLLAEADDAETLAALAVTSKPPMMRTVVVPPGEPRTKPRALNLGLALARGALITVFDAEDRPEPGQLRDAAARYAVVPDDVACLQARLAITHGNLLQSLFALEYAALFDIYNIGLARLGMPLPLGGTSNHFRGMGQQTPNNEYG